MKHAWVVVLLAGVLLGLWAWTQRRPEPVPTTETRPSTPAPKVEVPEVPDNGAVLIAELGAAVTSDSVDAATRLTAIAALKQLSANRADMVYPARQILWELAKSATEPDVRVLALDAVNVTGADYTELCQLVPFLRATDPPTRAVAARRLGESKCDSAYYLSVDVEQELKGERDEAVANEMRAAIEHLKRGRH
jgi:hypothetical protein